MINTIVLDMLVQQLKWPSNVTQGHMQWHPSMAGSSVISY